MNHADCPLCGAPLPEHLVKINNWARGIPVAIKENRQIQAEFDRIHAKRNGLSASDDIEKRAMAALIEAHSHEYDALLVGLSDPT